MPYYIGHIRGVINGQATGNRIAYRNREHRKLIVQYIRERFDSYQIYITEEELRRMENRKLTNPPHTNTG